MFKITNNCVGCHNCFSECPMQAIEWVGKKYEIDPDICVECGLCAKVCHTSSIIDVDAPDNVIYHEPRTLDADVVVCGCGSGIVAAVRAAQEGKKVIVLEKSDKIGGNTDYAHNFFPVYGNWWKEKGWADVREEAIAHYLKATNNELDPDVVRTAVYGVVDFFDWLCTQADVSEVYHLVDMGSADAHGPIYGQGLLDFPNRIKDNLNCRDDAIGPGWGGTYVKYTMLDLIKNQNLDVTILTEHAAKHLLLDESGAIRGVIAEDPGGTTTINTRAVILATGGFGKNDDLIREFKPWFFEYEDVPIHRFSVPGDTGDGILMLRELGVEPDPHRLNVSMFGPKHHPFSNTLADIALEPQVIQVNLNGERWVDESIGLHGMTPALMEQPKCVCYAIQSLDNLKKIADHFINGPQFASKKNLYETWFEELEDECRLDMPAKKADTLEELAALCGMPADALVNTVKKYNEFCANGKDEDFGKPAGMLWPIENGPYYAIYEQRFSEACMGGLMVDGDCRVLRNDGSYIPGLYGVGDATSAMHIDGMLAVISELTWAMASSYTSGNNAVSYLDSLSA